VLQNAPKCIILKEKIPALHGASRGTAVQCNAHGKFQRENGDGGAVPCRAAPRRTMPDPV